MLHVHEARILIYLLSMTTLIQLARDNDPFLKEVKGIIIAPDSTSIPQDIIFIPFEYDNLTSIKSCLSSALLDQKLKAYEIYFQGMLTMTPDLQTKLNSQQYITGIVDTTIFPKSNVKILLGIVAFSKQSLQWVKFSEKTKEYDFQLRIAENSYPLHVVYNVNILGIPQFFETPEK